MKHQENYLTLRFIRVRELLFETSNKFFENLRLLTLLTNMISVSMTVPMSMSESVLESGPKSVTESVLVSVSTLDTPW